MPWMNKWKLDLLDKSHTQWQDTRTLYVWVFHHELFPYKHLFVKNKMLHKKQFEFQIGRNQAFQWSHLIGKGIGALQMLVQQGGLWEALMWKMEATSHHQWNDIQASWPIPAISVLSQRNCKLESYLGKLQTLVLKF